MGKDYISFNKKGKWWHCYDEDAFIIYDITGYKMFRTENGFSIGIPAIRIKKVVGELENMRINYRFGKKGEMHDFGSENRYQESFKHAHLQFTHFLNSSIPKNDISLPAQKYTGDFMIEMSDGKRFIYVIGTDIETDSPLVEKLYYHNVGAKLIYKNKPFTLVMKNISKAD